MNYQYTYDKMDNITAKQTEHGDYGYGYDDLYRLTAADNPIQTDEAFTYDSVGNRLTAVDTTGDWTYNQNNELLTTPPSSSGSTGGSSFEYDPNGNMIQKTVDGVVTSYVYNVEDRLTEVWDGEAGTGSLIAEYYYDPFGRRLWKDVGGQSTYFHYTDEGLVGEYDGTGAEIKTYGYKPGSTWTTDPIFIKQNNTYYFYHNDHLGTPQKITAMNGAVVWSAKYNSFGEANVEVETVENNLRFPGQYEDEETGLHYNWFRYYDPLTGRYSRTDPIGLSAGINLYPYAGGNPIGNADPNGQFVITVPTIILISFVTVATVVVVDYYIDNPPQVLNIFFNDGSDDDTTILIPPPEPIIDYPKPDPDPWERYQMCRAMCKGTFPCSFIKRHACLKLCFLGFIADFLDSMKL